MAIISNNSNKLDDIANDWKDVYQSLYNEIKIFISNIEKLTLAYSRNVIVKIDFENHNVYFNLEDKVLNVYDRSTDKLIYQEKC